MINTIILISFTLAGLGEMSSIPWLPMSLKNNEDFFIPLMNLMS